MADFLDDELFERQAAICGNLCNANRTETPMASKDSTKRHPRFYTGPTVAPQIFSY